MRIVGALVVCALSLAACSGSDDGPPRAEDPTLLSSRGLYSDIERREVVTAAFEYEPDYPLWSDGADKRRWLILPPGGRVDVSDMAHWDFPLGTKLFKEFAHAGKLLETRLIERIKTTGRVKEDFFMGTFVWRADQTDAQLVTDGRHNVNRTEHDVPAQKFCIVCHRGEPGGVLGFSAVQLSASGALQRAARRKLLSEDPGRTYPIPGDEVQRAAIGMLNANCGHCHSETGMADFMHLRVLPDEVDRAVEELDAYRSTVGVELSDEWEDHPSEFSVRIVPGDPERSAIAYRMSQRGDDALVPDQMPPLATNKVDEDGLAAVQAWIASLPRALTDAGVEPGSDDAAVRDAEAEAEMDAAIARDAAVAHDAAVGADAAADGGHVEPVDAGGTGPLGEAAGKGGSVEPTESGAAGNFGAEGGAGAAGGTVASVDAGTDSTVANEPDSGATAGGAAGSAGSSGGSGVAGAAGIEGSTGAGGTEGTAGSTAGSGVAGTTGTAGSNAAGATGAAGSTAGSSAAGTTGTAGSTAGSNAAGTTGSAGSAGAAGIAGSTPGAAGSGAPSSEGASGATSVAGGGGAAGCAGSAATGAAGATGIAGSIAVASDNGAAGATVVGSTAATNDCGAADTAEAAGDAGVTATKPRRRWWRRGHHDAGDAGDASADNSSSGASEADACNREPGQVSSDP